MSVKASVNLTMTNSNSQRIGLSFSRLRLLPYLILGLLIFSLNSAINLNYFLKGYLVVLEAQVGILVLYFLIAKVIKRNKKNSQKIN